MNLHCTQCHQSLTPADLNIKEGVALCPSCGKLTRLSELAGTTPMASLMTALMDRQGVSPEATDLSYQWRDVPRGCAVQGWPGQVTLKASTRSFATGAFMVFFTLFWNSIVSVFVSLVIASYLHHLFGVSIGKMSNLPLLMTVFLTVFLIPFVLVGAFTFVTAVMAFVGSVRVTVRGHQGKVSTGVGPIRWSRVFDASHVVNVSLTRAGKNNGPSTNTSGMAILIEADKPVKFGSLLPSERQQWLASASAVVLMNPGSPDETTLLTLGDPHAHAL